MMLVRAGQGAGYLAMATVGVVMLAEPSRMITGQMGVVAPFWAWMMAIGGTLGVFAMISRVWIGETLGLPFLYVGVGMWGIAYLRQLPYTSGRFVAGVFLLGVACFLFAHWRSVYHFGNEAINARIYEKRMARGEH